MEDVPFEGEKLDGWHARSVPEVRDACIKVTDDVCPWKRSGFYLAWKSYCALTANHRAKDSDHYIGPTFDTTMAGVEGGKHTLPNFDAARSRIQLGLKRIKDAI
jgi:hypothetical protein